MKIIVVGAGLMGLATAWALIRRGHTVTVYEQGPIPNPPGSSVDEHRLIRFPYGPSLGYTVMVRDAYAAWARLWADLGRVHYAETGTLVLEAPGGEWARQSMVTLRQAGIAFEALTPAEVARRFPHVKAQGIENALWQEQGGALFAQDIVADLARWLAARGATLRPASRVAALDADRARIVTQSGLVDTADAVAVTAGPWSTKLRPDFAARVTPSRQVNVYVDPAPDHAAAWANGPMILDIGADAGLYAVPPRLGRGLKFGDHHASRPNDPDAPRVATQSEIDAILRAAAARFADFERYTARLAKVCFYDNSPGENFIAERIGAAGFLLTGFSGHGFKFGALVGEATARTLIGERDGEWLKNWAAGRQTASIGA